MAPARRARRPRRWTPRRRRRDGARDVARRAETTDAPRHFYKKAEAEEEASDDARRRPYRIEASTGMGNYIIGPGGTIEPISAGVTSPGRKPARGASWRGAGGSPRGGGARRVPALTPAHDDGRAARRDRVPRAGGAHAARGGDQARRAAEDAALTEEERNAARARERRAPGTSSGTTTRSDTATLSSGRALRVLAAR